MLIRINVQIRSFSKVKIRKFHRHFDARVQTKSYITAFIYLDTGNAQPVTLIIFLLRTTVSRIYTENIKIFYARFY